MESEKDVHSHCTYPKSTKNLWFNNKATGSINKVMRMRRNKAKLSCLQTQDTAYTKTQIPSKDLVLTNSIMVWAIQLPCKVLSLSYTPKGNDCQWEYGCGGYYWEGN